MHGSEVKAEILHCPMTRKAGMIRRAEVGVGMQVGPVFISLAEEVFSRGA
jgi:hypothetical protein